MKTDKLILDACCGPRMMWFDKRNPQAVFMDIRDEEHILCDGRSLEVHPDVIGDFRSIPFEDATFRLVVFDPPHLVRLGDNSYMAHKYGKLLSTWEVFGKQTAGNFNRLLATSRFLFAAASRRSTVRTCFQSQQHIGVFFRVEPWRYRGLAGGP